MAATSKWWPMLASTDPKQIEWCHDGQDNVRAKFQGDVEWRYMRGDGVSAELAYFKGMELLEDGRRALPPPVRGYLPEPEHY